MASIGIPFLNGKRENFWEASTTFVWVFCGLVAFHLIRAIIEVWREIRRQPKTQEVESLLYYPDNRRPRETVILIPPAHFQIKLIAIGLVCLIILGGCSYVVHALGASAKSVAPTLPQPFSIALKNSFYTSERDQLGAIWVLSQGGNGKTLSPTNAAIFIRLSNLQSIPSLVDIIEVDSKNEGGEWLRVTLVPTTGSQQYWGISLASLTEITDSPMLQNVLADHPMDPHSTAEGWLLFEYPKDHNRYKFTGEFRLTITDAAGAKFVSETLKADLDSIKTGFFKVHPPAIDGRLLPLRFWTERSGQVIVPENQFKHFSIPELIEKLKITIHRLSALSSKWQVEDRDIQESTRMTIQGGSRQLNEKDASAQRELGVKRKTLAAKKLREQSREDIITACDLRDEIVHGTARLLYPRKDPQDDALFARLKSNKYGWEDVDKAKASLSELQEQLENANSLRPITRP